MLALAATTLAVLLGVFDVGYIELPPPRPSVTNGRAWAVSQPADDAAGPGCSVAVYVAPSDGTGVLTPSWTVDGVLAGELHVSPGGRMLVVLAQTFADDVLAEVYWEGRLVRRIRAVDLFSAETLTRVDSWNAPFAEAGASFRGDDDLMAFRMLTQDGPGHFTIDVANGVEWLERPEPPVVAEPEPARDVPSGLLAGRPPAALGVAFVLTLIAGALFGALFARWRQDAAERAG